MDSAALAVRRELMKTGIGASEIGTIAGLNPWTGAFDVWDERFHPRDDDEATYMMRRGTALEPGVVELLRQDQDLELEMPNESVRCETDPICFASPDCYVIEGGKRVAVGEVKAPGPFTGHLWFDEDGDPIIPDHIVAQNAWQMLGTDLPRGIVAADLGNKMVAKWIERDRGLEADLLEVAHSFWDRYILTGKPPPVDASDKARAFLDRRFPKNSGEDLIVFGELDDDERDRVSEMVRTGMTRRADMKAAETAYQEIKNRYKEWLGQRPGVEVPDVGKATWKNNKQKETTQWKLLAQLLLSQLEDKGTAAKLLQEYTQSRPGDRVLRFPPAPRTKKAKAAE